MKQTLSPPSAAAPVTFATEVEQIPADVLADLQRLAAGLPWLERPMLHGIKSRYTAAEASAHFPGFKRAFFLKIPPGGYVSRHSDQVPGRTDHIVVETNAHCVNGWADADGDHESHLELGKRYRVERDGDHWARNDGETDRIHLLLEYGT